MEQIVLISATFFFLYFVVNEKIPLINKDKWDKFIYLFGWWIIEWS